MHSACPPQNTVMRRTSSATPTRLRSLSGLSIEWLQVDLGEYQVIDAEPPWAREKEPQKDHEIERLGKIQEFGEPAERRCRFYISNRGSPNSYDHDAAKHHARERRDCPRE
jgi:hypothetical protein